MGTQFEMIPSMSNQCPGKIFVFTLLIWLLIDYSLMLLIIE